MSKFGIDVSHWQGDFDFEAARNSDDIEFAIIKAGGDDCGMYTDSKFEQYYNELASIGLPKGAYYFGCAFSEGEAIDEANHFVNIINGKKFEYPVFYDVEADMLDADNLTGIILAFLNTVRDAGYKSVGLYCSEYYINARIDIDAIKDADYIIWCAKYSDVEPHIGVNVDIWQFGGGVNFIRDPQINGTTVDQNYCYSDFEENDVIGGDGDTPEPTPRPDPTPSCSFHTGDCVRVINAVTYDGVPFTCWYDEYTVMDVSGNRVVIGVDGVVTAAVNACNLELVGNSEPSREPSEDVPDPEPSAPTTGFSVGDTVKVTNAVTYDGVGFTCYYDTYTVIEVSGDRVVIGVDCVVTAAVNASNLSYVDGSTPAPVEDNIPYEPNNDEPSGSTDIQVGDTVRFVGSTAYDGQNVTSYYNEYTVTEINGDRVVLSVGETVFAAVNASDIERV